jgi:hypothetical protein
MKWVTSAYLARLFSFADNFRSMVKKEYLVADRDVSRGNPFEKMFLFNLARSVALIACTVPEMEDAILLAKKLGPDQAKLRKYFDDFAQATAERKEIFLQISQMSFTPNLFDTFPTMEPITIKSLPAVFDHFFKMRFKRGRQLLGVYPEIIPFKEAVAFDRIGIPGFKPGATRKLSLNQLHGVGFAREQNPDPARRYQFTQELVDAIEKASHNKSVLYKEGYKDGIRLRLFNETRKEVKEYKKGYFAGQNEISSISLMVQQMYFQDGDKDKIYTGLTKDTIAVIAQTRAKMAYSGALSIKMLTFEGMEKSLELVSKKVPQGTLGKCIEIFQRKSDIAAGQAELAYREINATYQQAVHALSLMTKRKSEKEELEKEVDMLKRMERRARIASESARKIATDTRGINIPLRITKGRPMSRRYKSRR